MVQVVKLVTHHDRPLNASRAWARCGVCAVGVVYEEEYVDGDVDTIRQYRMDFHGKKYNQAVSNATVLLKFRDEVEIGDIVIAYIRNNTVAFVGVITGDMEFNDENEVGSEDGFGYPNQRSVKWLSTPRFFDRLRLGDIADWVSRKGTLLIKKDYNIRKLVMNLTSISRQVSEKPQSANQIQAFLTDSTFERTRLTELTKKAKIQASGGRTEELPEDAYWRSNRAERREIMKLHNKLSNNLKHWLERKGCDVTQEHNRVDVEFWHGNQFCSAELKICHKGKPIWSIREAVGQLFYYELRRLGIPADKWYIILDEVPDKEGKEFVEVLRTEFQVPVYLGWRNSKSHSFYLDSFEL